VLFSNSWCGFCQRTDLVVRELHRSFKSFISLNSQVANAQDLQTKGTDLNSYMNTNATLSYYIYVPLSSQKMFYYSLFSQRSEYFQEFVLLAVQM
jgi:thiol-disulfide isomerase/thioredoxin